MEETERSLHDAIMIVRRAIKVVDGVSWIFVVISAICNLSFPGWPVSPDCLTNHRQPQSLKIGHAALKAKTCSREQTVELLSLAIPVIIPMPLRSKVTLEMVRNHKVHQMEVGMC